MTSVPEVDRTVDRTADVAAARRALSDLTGHLRTLGRSDLTRLQAARLDLAIATAETLGTHLGGPATPPPAYRVPTATGFRPFRVLVVDDNAINRHVAVGMLRLLGIEAITAETGEEALDMLSSFPYDLALLDVMLPDIDGFEITRQLRRRFGDRPAIVGVTALPDAEARGREAGMNAVFSKPLRLREVIEALDLCIAA